MASISERLAPSSPKDEYITDVGMTITGKVAVPQPCSVCGEPNARSSEGGDVWRCVKHIDHFDVPGFEDLKKIAKDIEETIG